MKTYLHALAMCQSTFCAIPCPWRLWDEQAKDKMLLFLPLVGLETGLVWACLAWAARRLALPAAVTGIILCAWPYLATGGIHLDGFLDVTDAVRSWRDREHRQAILKDPHVGSFAVIGAVLLVLCQFALFSAGRETADAAALVLIPVVSRCCSALAVTGLKPMSTSQYASQKRNRTHLWALGILLCAVTAGGFLHSVSSGLACLGCLAGYAAALFRGVRSLGGMNGDIAGYALTVGELCGAAVYALL